MNTIKLNFGSQNKKDNRGLNGHTVVAMSPNAVLKAMALLAMFSVPLNANSQVKSVPANNQTANEAAAAKTVISEKTLYSEKYGRVVIKAVNRKGGTDKFDMLYIKVGTDPEGYFLGWNGKLSDRIKVGSMYYTPDANFDTGLNEVLGSSANGSLNEPLPGTVPTKRVNIGSVPAFAHYKEVTSRQFSDEDGNVFLVGFYYTDGKGVDDSGQRYYNKAMLFALQGEDAAITEVKEVDPSGIIFVSKRDGKVVTLEHKEIARYLDDMYRGNKKGERPYFMPDTWYYY
jgi:hypothetical protein